MASDTTRSSAFIERAGVALIAVCLGAPSVARADSTDACIAAAEHGQTLRKSGHLRAARSELVTCARDICPGAVASDCKRWLGEVDASTPSIVVRALDGAGHEVADVALAIDGAPFADHLDGRAISVDPGEHTVACVRRADRATTRVLVREGEHDRLVTIAFTSAPPPPSVRRGIPALAWVFGGAGVAAMGIGALLWIDGVNERDDLRASCGSTRACTSSDESPAKTKLVVGDVAFGAGLVALGAAVWLGVTTHVDVVPARGGAVATYGAAF